MGRIPLYEVCAGRSDPCGFRPINDAQVLDPACAGVGTGFAWRAAMLRVVRPILRFRHEVILTLLAGLAACGFRGADRVDVDANEPDGSIEMVPEDSDADGIPDATDNCAKVGNLDQ